MGASLPPNGLVIYVRSPPIADGQPANQYPTATAVQWCETDQPGGAHPDPVTTPS